MADHQYEARFPDSPATVRIVVKKDGAPLSPEEISVELRQSQMVTESLFSIHNAKGEHLFPLMGETTCPDCGNRSREYVPPENTEVHVLGPMELSEKEKVRLLREVETKLHRGSWPAFRAPASQYVQMYDDFPEEPVYRQQGGPLRKAETGPAPYKLWRRGNFIASIPAAVIERFAAENADFHALLWGPNATRGGR